MATGVGLWCIATIEYNFPPAPIEPLHSDEEHDHWADSMTTVSVSPPCSSLCPLNDTPTPPFTNTQQACHFQMLPFKTHRFIVIKHDAKGQDKHAARSTRVNKQQRSWCANLAFIKAALTAGYGRWSRSSEINYLSKYRYVSQPVYNLISNLSVPLFS